MYSFSVKGFKIGTRNLAKSYVGVPLADKKLNTKNMMASLDVEPIY